MTKECMNESNTHTWSQHLIKAKDIALIVREGEVQKSQDNGLREAFEQQCVPAYEFVINTKVDGTSIKSFGTTET